MKLFLISQDVNNDYDTYSDVVVCAENEEQAKWIHPFEDNWDGKTEAYGSWCSVENVKVEYLGEAKEGIPKGVILASFHAG